LDGDKGLSEKVTFKCKIIRSIYDSETFKCYAVDVDKQKYPFVKLTKYGNAAICGDIQVLAEGQEYEIIGVGENTKNGYSYKVSNIRRDKPHTEQEMQSFLEEILTPRQASELFKAYPNIVDKIIQNDYADVDLSKIYGVKEKTFAKIVEKVKSNYSLIELVGMFKGVLSISILKKLYSKYASAKVVENKLREDGYKCLCGISRVGFKMADNLLQELEREKIIEFDYDLKTSPQRCLSCVLYFLEENESNGNTKMSIKRLKNECDTLVPECSEHFVNAIKNDRIFYDKATLMVGLKSTYEVEKYIADHIIEGLKSNIIWDYDIEKYRNFDGGSLTDEQIGALQNICRYNISILNGAGGCVDCDTEYFNGYCWKPISEYQDGERVLQYNKDGTAELVYPMNYIKHKSNSLWHFSTKYGLDQCLSDEHNCYYITSKGNLNEKKFKDIRISQTEGVGFHGRFITTFDYNGRGINLSENEIRLMVAVLADGSFYYRHNCSNETYSQCRFHIKKDRKKQRLKYLFEQLNLIYREVDSAAEGYTDFYVNSPFRAKNYPIEWYNCSQEQLKIIADEVIYWDCYYETNNRFSTVNKNDADFIQFVFTSLGYRATISTNDRVGENYLTNDKYYKRQSVEYTVSWTKHTLIGMTFDKRKMDKWTKIEPYKTKDGYEYCFTVPSHILVLRRNDKIFITGNCGKSATSNAIIKMLQDNHKTFTLFAPTGRAAKVLSGYTKQKASTIHRGLGFKPPDKWVYNEDCKLFCDVLIIDEFSMTDIFIAKKIFEALDLTKTKLLIIGDNAQLPSVSCGNLLHDFMMSDIIPTTTLTRVFRYGEGGLMTVATDVRNCKQYFKQDTNSEIEFYGKNKDYAFINSTPANIIKNTLGLYKKLLSQGNIPSDIQVLTAYNKGEYGTIVLNNHLQKIANKNYGKTDYIKVGEVTYYVGDIVIQKKNNYEAELANCNRNIDFDMPMENPVTFIANGEIGIITEINGCYLTIDFNDNKVIYHRDNMVDVGLGYCISVHKSQGGNSKIIILLTPSAHTYMLNSNLIYVGLTRMREKCFHLGDKTTVNRAIKKKENFDRNTFMQELLKENKND
jgi:hypothetical protein